MSSEKIEYLLRLGDSTLILSQRLSEWCGKGPALEEDIALTNVALDLLGQARLWLDYAAEIENRGRNADQLAYLRDSREFRNLLLVEQPNGNYADTMVRQFLFDSWHYFLLQDLRHAADARIAGIAEKACKEAHYHIDRSGDLMVRLGDGNARSHELMQAAIDELWTFTGELFMVDSVDHAMAAAGIAPDPEQLRPAFLAHVSEILAEATLCLPGADAWMQKGGKQGLHGEDFGFLLAEMQFLQRTYPGALW